jgi:hypothetical protein
MRLAKQLSGGFMRTHWVGMGIVVGVLLAGATAPLEAGPISGSFSISGNFLAVNADGVEVELDDATALDFIDLLGSTPTPGESGTFLVNSANGDFASLVGSTGLIQDFTFAGPAPVSGDYPVTPLLAFQSVGGLTFDLASVTIDFQGFGFLDLIGTGTFNLANYDPTPGTFIFSGNGEDSTFSFSASETTTAVPEPTSMVLFGAGVLLVGFRRRRSMLAPH